MPDQDLIDELKREADADEAKGRALLAAAADKRTTVRVLEARLGPRRQLQLAEPPQAYGHGENMTDRITRVVRGMVARQISVSEVHKEMLAQGAPLPEDIRARISTVLNRLEGKGVIVKIAQGTGSVPNTYKLSEGAQAA